MKNKNRSKKSREKSRIFLYVVAALIIFCIAVIFFLSFHKTVLSVFVFPENPNQGETIFIRVKSEASEVVGNFGTEKLIFYKKGNTQEWIAFLGIDADQAPGDYDISVDTSTAEHLTEKIKVGLADFSSEAVAQAPSSQKTGITKAEAVENIRKNDNPVINKVLDNSTEQPYFTDPFSNPLSKMEKSGFSFGKFIGFAQDKLQHFGIDLRAQKQTDIYAVNDGKIVATLNLSNYGKTIIIDHGLDIFSMYLHLDDFKVSTGDVVRRGQLIGLSGDTGYATAPHLHFSMRVDGQRVDPIEFIQATQKMNDNFILADITNALLKFF